MNGRQSVMSDEERRERARASAAAYRARKKAEREAAVAAAKAPAAELGVMGTALESAIAAMKWLATSDLAMVTSARMLAREIDALEQLTTSDAAARTLRAHGLLRTVLESLGGSPKVRMQLELRSRKLAPAAEPGGKLPGNVTKFERPKPRRKIGENDA